MLSVIRRVLVRRRQKVRERKSNDRCKVREEREDATSSASKMGVRVVSRSQKSPGKGSPGASRTSAALPKLILDI